MSLYMVSNFVPFAFIDLKEIDELCICDGDQIFVSENSFEEDFDFELNLGDIDKDDTFFVEPNPMCNEVIRENMVYKW